MGLLREALDKYSAPPFRIVTCQIWITHSLWLILEEGRPTFFWFVISWNALIIFRVVPIQGRPSITAKPRITLGLSRPKSQYAIPTLCQDTCQVQGATKNKANFPLLHESLRPRWRSWSVGAALGHAYGSGMATKL